MIMKNLNSPKKLNVFIPKSGIFFIINIIFSLLIGFILAILKINHYYIYGIFAFLISFLVFYFFKKGKINEKEDFIVYYIIILLMYFGAGSLFIAVSFFINATKTIYAYDLGFLGLFCIFVSSFLWKRRGNLKKEGLMYLYRTKVGIKLINYIGTKYKKTLSVLSVIAIISGYILMALMTYFLWTLIYIYLFQPKIVQAIKIPPIMPLVPYVPELFKIDFLPPFYFTYWIIAIAVIAIFHEFAHGIIAKRYGISIKTTGFGFLGPFLAAFVEPDEKVMEKKPKFQQISILAAGTFANIIMTVLFFIIFILFFTLAYSASGAVFDAYANGIEKVSAITMISGISVSNLNSTQLLDFINKNNIKDNIIVGEGIDSMNLTEVTANNSKYLFSINDLKLQLEKNPEYIVMYQDLPAIRYKLAGAIIKLDDKKIRNREDLSLAMKSYNPGDNVLIVTKTKDKVIEYNIILGEDSNNKTRPMIGVGYIDSKRGGILARIFSFINLFREPGTYYAPKILPELTVFIYNLLWWLILINFSVALMNMLPFTIFDGGRMFMLTVWSITKSEKAGKLAFKITTYLILAALALVMFGYVRAMFV